MAGIQTSQDSWCMRDRDIAAVKAEDESTLTAQADEDGEHAELLGKGR
jgi:hypothetical protein